MSYKERLKIESEELISKIEKLSEFIFENPTYNTLSKTDQVLLSQQLVLMNSYYGILEERISRAA